MICKIDFSISMRGIYRISLYANDYILKKENILVSFFENSNQNVKNKMDWFNLVSYVYVLNIISFVVYKYLYVNKTEIQ